MIIIVKKKNQNFREQNQNTNPCFCVFEKSESRILIGGRLEVRERLAGRREREDDVMCDDVTRVLFVREEPKGRTR